ncbi:hypothetical protein Bca4012_000071 [Brassica carinata]|uniref:Myb-like domain-containing protein n=1 Tax=Brassica carinata TaxID=52824 RepID=A0A8X8BHG0_BRACI|nr:hypothetical protein Bca52824_006078 [Brassica carinata]
MDSNNNPSQSQSYFSLLNFPYDSFSPSVNFSSSQTQTPFLSPQPSSQPSQPPSQAEETPEERRERRIWSTQDDLVLISGWLNTSKDSIVGNDQRGGCFWKRIADYYASSTHVLDGAEPRNHEHCRQRWQKISREVSRFCGTYADAKREKASGINDLDILQNAHQIFNLLYKKKFGLEYAWNVLRFEQKWCDHTPMNPTPKTTSSNKRKADDAAPSTESVVGEHESRPPGIKAMKRLRNKGKDKDAPASNISQIWEIKQKDLDVKKELQKMSLLDTLIARNDTLDEDEKVIKKSLMPHYYALQLGLAEVGYTGCEEEAQAEPDYGTQLMQLRDLQSLADQRVVHLERVSAQGSAKPCRPLMWPYCICCIVVAMAVALLYLV